MGDPVLVRHSRVESVGSYVPSRVVSNDELIAQMALPSDFDLEKLTGIKRRHVYDQTCSPPEDSLSMAVRAARAALDRSRYDASDIDVIVCCSIARIRDGDTMTFEPSFALVIKNELGSDQAIHFDVSNACAGMLTGVLLVDRMIRSGMVRRGMVVSGEKISPVAETAVREIASSYDPQFASLTVGDAAAAVILDDRATESDRLEYIELISCSAYADLCIGKPSDQGPGIALYTDNKSMHNSARYKLWTSRQRDFLEQRHSSFDAEQYDFVIHHQFSEPAAKMINIIAAQEFSADIPANLNVMDEYGNTASTSHFLVLDTFLSRNDIPRGSKLLLIPAASGVVTGYLAITVSSLQDAY